MEEKQILEQILEKIENLQESVDELSLRLKKHLKEAEAEAEAEVQTEDQMTVADFVRKKVAEGAALSSRTYNALTRKEVVFAGPPCRRISGLKVSDLKRMTTRDVLSVRNIGKKSLEELLLFFEKEGVYLADRNEEMDMSVPEFVQKKVREDHVPMTTRTYNIVQRGMIMAQDKVSVAKDLHDVKVKDLQGMELLEFTRLRYLGAKSLEELVVFFAKAGIYFKDKKGRDIHPSAIACLGSRGLAGLEDLVKNLELYGEP